MKSEAQVPAESPSEASAAMWCLLPGPLRDPPARDVVDEDGEVRELGEKVCQGSPPTRATSLTGLILKEAPVVIYCCFHILRGAPQHAVTGMISRSELIVLQ